MNPESPLGDVAWVILNFNSGDDLRQCLRALRAAGVALDRIFLVDNGSSDRSVDVAVADWPGLECHRTGRNGGFTGGNNRGIDLALGRGFRRIAILNPDCRVDELAPQELWRTSQMRKDAAVIAPSVWSDSTPPNREYNGTVDVSAQSVLNWLRKTFHFWWAPLDFPGSGHPVEVHSFVGCCFLLNYDVLDHRERLDERLFVHAGETELVLRLHRARRRIVFAPSARVFHRGGITVQRTGVSMERAVLGICYCARKHLPGFLYLLFLAYFTMRGVGAAVRDRLIGGEGTLIVRLRGILGHLLGRV